MLDNIASAFASVFSAYGLFAIASGVFVGIVIGGLPGLTATMGIAIMFPLTFYMEGMNGLYMLLGLYCGVVYGGSISAILLNTPGTPASAATSLDGYQMTRRGEAGRALSLSTTSSFFGGIFSSVALVVISPLLARVALSFGAPEYFALAMFGLSIITSVSSKSVVKGIIGGLGGLAIACIGTDPVTSHLRFTAGSFYLMGGIHFVPILIGVFAFSQGMLSIEEEYGRTHEPVIVKVDRVLPTLADMKTVWGTMLRSSVIGTVIGAIPGTGGDIAAFISYNEARRFSKRKDQFGTGIPEGVAAPEAGNNAVTGGAMVPLLTLGIPGDSVTAIMLGSLMMLGLQPGPLLFQEHPVQVYGIFVTLFTANVMMFVMGILGIRIFTKILNISRPVLSSMILCLCVVGSFAINNSLTEVLVMVLSGIIGYFLIKLDFTMSPIIIGLILGPMAEANLRRSFIISDGDYSFLYTRPVTAVLLALAVLTLFAPILGPRIKRRWATKNA